MLKQGRRKRPRSLWFVKGGCQACGARLSTIRDRKGKRPDECLPFMPLFCIHWGLLSGLMHTSWFGHQAGTDCYGAVQDNSYFAHCLCPLVRWMQIVGHTKSYGVACLERLEWAVSHPGEIRSFQLRRVQQPLCEVHLLTIQTRKSHHKPA
jgi:hypothetical protein